MLLILKEAHLASCGKQADTLGLSVSERCKDAPSWTNVLQSSPKDRWAADWWRAAAYRSTLQDNFERMLQEMWLKQKNFLPDAVACTAESTPHFSTSNQLSPTWKTFLGRWWHEVHTASRHISFPLEILVIKKKRNTRTSSILAHRGYLL